MLNKALNMNWSDILWWDTKPKSDNSLFLLFKSNTFFECLYMKHLIFLCGLVSTSFVYAAPMSEELSICYNFKSDKLVHKSSCIVHSGYGAGGSYVALEQGKSIYNIETQITYNEKTDSSEESEPTLNELPATFYTRDFFTIK